MPFATLLILLMLYIISLQSGEEPFSLKGKHALDGQRFHREVEVLKQVRLSDIRTQLRLVVCS